MTVMSSSGQARFDEQRVSDDQVNTSEFLRLDHETNDLELGRYARSEQRHKTQRPNSRINFNTTEMKDLYQMRESSPNRNTQQNLVRTGDSRLSISALVNEKRKQLAQSYQQKRYHPANELSAKEFVFGQGIKATHQPVTKFHQTHYPQHKVVT